MSKKVSFFTFLVMILVLSLAACAPREPEEEAAYEDPEAARQALMDADRAWSETVGDVDAFTGYFAEDGYFLPPNAPWAQGPGQVRPMAEQLFATPGLELNWTAEFAEVAESGDLGYTVGTFQETLEGPDGEPVTREGKYTTVWRKTEAGEWKVVADTFNYNAPAGSGAE